MGSGFLKVRFKLLKIWVVSSWVQVKGLVKVPAWIIILFLLP